MPTAIGEDDSLRDHFLLAMPNLSEGIFHQSITYLCEHDSNGAMGIIINRPLELSVQEIFEHLKVADDQSFDHLPVLAGGPVQTDHGFVLHRDCDHSWDATLAVTDRMRLTTSRDILQAIAQGGGPRQYLIALGYAGWSPGQLEAEIAQNAWLTTPSDAEIIFRLPYEERLNAAAGSLGIDLNLISGEAGHA